MGLGLSLVRSDVAGADYSVRIALPQVRRPSKRHSPHFRDVGRGLYPDGRAYFEQIARTFRDRSWRTALHPSGRERQGIDQNTGGNCDPALRDSSAASLASDCGSSRPQSCGGEHTRDYFLSVFGRGRCRNRTPGPPPLSSMNSTPAASRARRTAKSLAVVIDVWGLVSSARRIVVEPRVDSRARSSALQRRRARAALICALVRGFSFILTCLIPYDIVHTVQSGYDRIDLPTNAIF